MRCTARIDVYDDRGIVRCARTDLHDGLDIYGDHRPADGRWEWWDDWPGAIPHDDPADRERVLEPFRAQLTDPWRCSILDPDTFRRNGLDVDEATERLVYVSRLAAARYGEVGIVTRVRRDVDRVALENVAHDAVRVALQEWAQEIVRTW